MAAPQTDWDPGAYHRFRGPRLRPAVDLARALPPLPDGPVIDLGCGSGLSGQALAVLRRPVTGVDASPAMLQEARATGAYSTLDEADIAGWAPDAPPALIFSNAALHWLDGHDSLLPRLAGSLAPGGTLAVQMPHQNRAPSHRLWVTLAEEIGLRDAASRVPPGARMPVDYHRMLSPLGTLSLWETEYFQALPSSESGHPVRRFTESTFARPILTALDEAGRDRLIAAYEAVIDRTYPCDAEGGVLFPFRRLFFTLTVPGTA